MFSPCKPRALPQLVRGPSALTSPVGGRQLELVSVVWDSGAALGTLIWTERQFGNATLRVPAHDYDSTEAASCSLLYEFII